MPGADDTIICFGPFRLRPSLRRLERDGIPLELGDRALDILITLVERSGELVSHRELISCVWRNLVVSPGNLRVHVSALRKALGDSEGGAPYIENVTGQGYCFTASITREVAGAAKTPAPVYPDVARKQLMLPAKLARMLGRDDVVDSIGTDLLAERFVTIIGPGGMGKTTVAIAVAHRLRDRFTHGACFVDVSAVEDPELVAATVATSLGLAPETVDVLPTLLEYLRTRQLLLVLDNCEHVVDVASTLAEAIFRETSGVCILATSREAFRVEGEHAYWLPPLATPSPDSSMAVADLLRYPAVQLFMERAGASGGRFELDAELAPLVASICGRLDGMALAIELAAGRAGRYGIAATAELMNRNLGLDWHGRRTAYPRHQTLRALLDWSYEVLAEEHRRALRNLSVLVGGFSVQAAIAVVHDEPMHEAAMLDTLDALISKSLVSVQSSDGGLRFRILETTRAYSREKLLEHAEDAAAARRHATYFAELLNRHHRGHIDLDYATHVHVMREHLGNVRAALDWCFAQRDERFDAVLAVRLAAAAVPLFFELSLLSEALRWSEAGLAALDDTSRAGHSELTLTTIWAISSMWVRGSNDVLAAIDRAMRMAVELDAPAQRLRLQATRHMVLTRKADFRATLDAATDWDKAARQVDDVACLAISDLMQAQSRHYLGDQAAARKCFEAGFARAGSLNLQMCGMDQRVRALVAWSRTLWLSGFADRAVRTAHEAVESAISTAKPLNACFALLFTTPMFLWCRDLEGAQQFLDQLVEHSHWPALEPFHATALAMQGATLIGQGAVQRGTEILLGLRAKMGDECLNFMASSLACFLAEGMLASNRAGEALEVVRAARRAAVRGGEAVHLPELLRLQALALRRTSQDNELRCVRLLQRSCRIAQRQSALSWQLRSATTLAQIQAERGDYDAALHLLAPVYGRFTEGFETRDLQVSRQLLSELQMQARPANGLRSDGDFSGDGLQIRPAARLTPDGRQLPS